MDLSARLATFFSIEENKMELKENADTDKSLGDVSMIVMATVRDDYDKVLAEIDARMNLLERFLSRYACSIIPFTAP